MPHSSRSLLLLPLALAALTFTGCDAADPAASAASQARVDVCHYDADAGTFALITVGAPAVPAHLAHGDGQPGGPVPTQPDWTFDEACVPQPPPPSACVVAGGVEVGGACWFLGALGQSCSAVCDVAGLDYDAATATYAGSGGTDAQCQEVLTALNAPEPIQAFGTGPGTGRGCVVRVDPPTLRWFRETNPTTSSASGLQARRACACE